MTRYFFDRLNGNDDNNGLSPETPFLSLEKANTLLCKPDDALLFKSGCCWEGQLAPQGSGMPGAPCILAAYGSGPRPLINGCGRSDATILLYNIEQWEVRGLEVTNTGAAHADKRIGILAMLKDYGTARHILIEDNYVHDVNGCIVERNRLIRGRVRDDMYCAGIWPWSADNTIIRYNEVAGYVGTKDGQGFDCDYNCIGTTHM